VDLRNSGTARSGMPSFGREVNVSSIGERQAALQTASKANLLHNEQMNIRTDPKAEIVKKMADSFFINNAKLKETDMPSFKEADQDEEISNANKFDAKVSTKGVESDSSNNDSDEDSLVIGQHLDVHA
jgi:hypothetical protein